MNNDKLKNEAILRQVSAVPDLLNITKYAPKFGMHSIISCVISDWLAFDIPVTSRIICRDQPVF